MDLYARALEWLGEGRRFALAAVVHALGSTPQKAGAKALFDSAGPIEGTLGGGCLEAEARRRALDALDGGTPFAFDLKLDDVDGWDDGLVCGGTVRIYVDPLVGRNEAAYRSMLRARAAKESGALITPIPRPGGAAREAMWIAEEAIAGLPGGLRDRTMEAAASERAVLVREEGAETFIEPIAPPPSLVIAGAGHIGKALAHHGARLGFEVTIIDDRPSFADRIQVPEAHHVICGDIAGELSAISGGPRTHFVIVTRGHRHDGEALAACIHKPAAYLGLIGSRRKSLLLRRRLVQDGIASEEEVRRVVSPMGLDIGAVTVEEIAISISAQLVAVRRRRALDAASLAVPAC